MIEEKEFNKRIKKLPVRNNLGYSELAYVRTDSGKVYSFCPLCRKIVVVDKDQIETETEGQIKLKGATSCDCRSWIIYLNKTFFKEGDKEVSVTRSLITCAAVFMAAIVALFAILELPDVDTIHWVEPVAILLFALMIAAFIGGVVSIFYPIELLFRRGPEEDSKKYFRGTLDKINRMIDTNQLEKRAKRKAEKAEEEKRKKSDEEKTIHGSFSTTSAGYAAAGYVAASKIFDDHDSYDSDSCNAPDSYLPEDFEPDLDPYDRQALYDEEVIDDWVLAGGGDPFDFDDRMDAMSDPFGFGSDGEFWD